MEFLIDVFLPVILYVVAIILLIILIILCIRLLKILDRADNVLKNVEDKVNTFNGVFSVMKSASDRVESIADSFAVVVTSTLSKIFGKFKGNYKEDEDYE